MILNEYFSVPDYDGLTIGNIPATVASWLNVPFDGLSPLSPSLSDPAGTEINRVIVLLVDALGWNLFKKQAEDFAWLTEKVQVRSKITSVFPSTTVAALSSLWTGVAPATHSLAGLRLFFPEFAVLGQMIKLTPVFHSVPDVLVDAGLDPETFLQWPGIGQQFSAAKLDSYAFKSHHFVDSALSIMHGRGVTKQYGIKSFADMMVQIRNLLSAKPKGCMFVSAYWSLVDTLSHDYGYDDPIVAAELRSVLYSLKTELCERLGSQASDGTLLCITGDHGQTVTPPHLQIKFADHPQLEQMLFMRPAGEPRTRYLHTKHGQQANVLDYLNTKLSHALYAMPSEVVLQQGLLGPLPHASTTLQRMGDVTVLMKDGYTLLNRQDNNMIGRHGGMTPAEMEVPWLVYRLDS